MKFWTDEGGERRDFPLREGSNIVGRHPSCHVVVPGRNVSKRHLQCYVDRGVVTIRDLGSSNGTTVNGNPVTSCVLNDGDEVRLGGYRLFLDTGGAAAPAGSEEPRSVDATVMMDGMAGPPSNAAAGDEHDTHNAGAFDIEPHGVGPAQPAESPGAGAYPPPPPEPAMDFAEGEDEDATPADGAFVPQLAERAAPSLQPQVVSRDGRMYLRDPRTNRELEIVPRGAGGGAPAAQPDLSDYYAERETAERKKNLWLIGGAIGVALLMIIALASLQTGPSDDEPGRRQKAFSRARYNDLCEQSIELMLAGKFGEARQRLQTANNEYPEYPVAKILGDIGKAWEESGKGLEEFDWLSVESLLRELERSRWATAKAKSFAADRVDWVYNVENQRAIVAKAIKHKADGEPERALREIEKVPRDSIVWQNHRHLYEEIRADCFRAKIQSARNAVRARDWQAAVQFAREAETYATDLQKAETARIIREATARQKEWAALNEANQLARTGRLGAAEEALAAVDDTGPFAKMKRNLLRSIREQRDEQKHERLLDRARRAYNEGNGAEAVELITRHNLTELYPLRERVAKLSKLFREVDEALNAKPKDWNRAKEKLLEIQTVETDHRVAYHRESVRRLAEIMNRRQEIAEDYKQRGDRAFQAGKYREARRLYMVAMRDWDKYARISADALRQLEHVAKLKYAKARDLRYQGRENWPEALKLFEEVQQCLLPGAELHRRAARQAAEIRNKMAEPDSE
jgi:hypothetical protein